MKVKDLSLYFETLRHLKLRQIYFQVFYRFRQVVLKPSPKKHNQLSFEVRSLDLQDSIGAPKSCHHPLTFSFLNTTKTFSEKIDWNFLDNGKLWAYNLNYFDFLHQPGLPEKTANELLDQFVTQASDLKEGIEPYPISLRGINWIKYFTYRKISEPRYQSLLYSHYRFLFSHIEYHLMGNHLLENGFSLLFAGLYFNDQRFYSKAHQILRAELEEQILSDGGHFELSPMYHQILLFRLLDCINLLRNNKSAEDGLLEFLESIAVRMLGWVKNITFSNGDIPMVNDSIGETGLSSSDLFFYASRLGIRAQSRDLSDSGYRMIANDRMEIFVDVGNIGPDYIPGHAHSDTFNFIIHVDGNPVIVEAGTSTYEKGIRRIVERSTESHNTVKINNQNQSDVWSSFRVGRRARIVHRQEQESMISASHDGYRALDACHERIWKWTNNSVMITDTIQGANESLSCVAFVHFHPDQSIVAKDNTIFAGNLKLRCEGFNRVELGDYEYAQGYNKTASGKVALIHFSKELKAFISLTN
jgi:hypothetical protein